MLKRFLTALGGILIVVAANPLFVDARPAGPTDQPQSLDAPRQGSYVDVARVIEASDIGLTSPTSVTFAPESASLLVSGTDAAGTPSVTSVSLIGAVQATDAVAADVADAGLAYDPTNDVLIAAPSDDRLVTIDAPSGEVPSGAAATDVEVPAADAGTPAGLGVSPRGEPLVLGADTVVQTMSVPDAGSPAAVTKELPLSGATEPLTGLAVAPNGHLFSIGAQSMTLYEFRANGKLLTTRDLSGEGIDSPQGMVIAPTADTSDARGATNLYLADAGTPEGTGAAVYEISLTAPVLSPQVAAAAVSSVTLENTFNTGAGSAWNPDSPDPSGLAYIPASETEIPAARRDRLVSGDGEVEEARGTGAGWHDVNVWFAPRNGSAQSATFNTTVAPTTPINKEPVGLAYDPVRNELYICDDGNGALVWVYNAVTMAQVRSFTVNNAPYNNLDSEGLAFGNGVLYMVDALDNDLIKVQPGGNGIVGTGGDDVVTNYDLEQFGQTEPEGLDVHPATGNVWVVSNRLHQGVAEPMLEVTPSGALVSTVSIDAANPNSAGGLAIAPPSDGSGGLNIYIADRGVDNNDDPTENDGEIYEFSLDSVPSNAPPVANNDSYATDEGTTLNEPAPGVLDNDTDADDDPLTAVLDTDAAHGNLTLNANGSFSYTPDAGYSGPDSFTYHANDGTADSNVATVSLDVTDSTPTLSGTITASGSPLQGAYVDVFTSAGSYVTSVPSNASGFYTVDLAPGDYKLRVNPREPDYPIVWHGGTSIATATVVSLSTDTDLDFALTTGVTLSGTITANGAPLQGAGVAIYTASGANWLLEVTSNASGFYTVDLAPGSYKLLILPHEPGYPTFWHGGTSHATATVVNLAVDTDLDFALTAE